MLSLIVAFLSCCAPVAPRAASDLPILEVTHDNTVVRESCRIRISPGLVIADSDNNGVIHITRASIEIEFESGSVLRGCPPGTRPDAMQGIGIRIQDAAAGADGRDGAQQVRPVIVVRSANISGFKCGLRVDRTSAVELSGCSFSDNFRQHLGSTPAAEDSADWLWPHDNASDKWVTQYGAAIHAFRSPGITIRDCTVRSGQNGIVLDASDAAQIYDNDCSFLSGWGLAMWNTSHSQIQRNAFDFCIRGYSHNVYNRGQDSAGILLFEQCRQNTFAFNSATHGGDGLFAFSGKGALGESPDPAPVPPGFVRAGNADTILHANDFSYAAAHGIETTFSFGFTITENRVIDNAICGIWGGYSQSMVIARNRFADNGKAGYGLERGGINIEHGAENIIIGNRFESNVCGIHLWSDEDPGIAKTPWYKANHKGSTRNAIARNHFTGDKLGIQLRATTATELSENQFEGVEQTLVSDAASDTSGTGMLNAGLAADLGRPGTQIGSKTPVGARASLRGRQNIIMGEWGPWDHQSPMLRAASRTSGGDTYELFGVQDKPAVSVVSGADVVDVQLEPPAVNASAPSPWRIRVLPKGGVAAYTIRISAPGLEESRSGTIVAASWNVRVFPWTVDPRENLEGWRAESQAAAARTATTDHLTLRYANAGPGKLKAVPAFSGFAPADRFGTIASTTLPLPAGEWSISTLSDDGVRVTVDGVAVIDNWTYHGPTRDTGTFKLDQPREVRIEVEHFEIDGFATLELSIAPAARK